jgi:GH24 family phage-related lysozyme (muramidase)
MTTSDVGVALIKEAEGFSPVLYQDNGRPCIGYGCDLTPTEAEQYANGISEPDADMMLRSKLPPIEQAINSHVTVTQNEFDAMVDFAYNLGWPTLLGSTLFHKLTTGDVKGASAEFPKWDHMNGRVLDGLLARRLKEQALFLQGS